MVHGLWRVECVGGVIAHRGLQVLRGRIEPTVGGQNLVFREVLGEPVVVLLAGAELPDLIRPVNRIGDIITGVLDPSSAWLGWSGALAVGATTEHADDCCLELGQQLVEAQVAPGAFGSALRRWMVMNR